MGDLGSIPGLGSSLGGGHDKPLKYSCLENPYGYRSLAGSSPWGHTELDTTEQLNTAQSAARAHFQKSWKQNKGRYYWLLIAGWSLPLVISGNFCKNRMVQVGNTTWLDADFFFFELKITLCNAVFQRIAKRDKKAFLSEQCKEVE